MEPITRELVRSLLPRRDPNGHKGTFGKVYVCGGCVGYTGAPAYAGEAAARTGSGLVFVGVPEEVYPIVAARCAVSMVHPLPRPYSALLERIRGCDAALIGPGLGRAADTEETVLALLRDLPGPVVLDADGINAAAAHMDVLEDRRGRVTVLTPHEGEFLRLGGEIVPGSPEQRERAAAAFARRYGCVLVLKGPGTIAAAPDGRTLVNTTGNCGMAKGGSGDMLAGMVLSLMGQGAEA
nr:NAD(P)H-hydrate dehydratase [Oscillospiraceae bacterium]